jgi:hypothetical protein
MKAALGEALIDLEPDRSRQFSLLLIKAVKVVRCEFKSCCNMQQVTSLFRISLLLNFLQPSFQILLIFLLQLWITRRAINLA